MPARIEDYAIIGDTKTVGLVDGSGSIDWWCAPRIDSGAVFAALLGTKHNGRWLMAPKHGVSAVSRHYEAETLILETVFETSTGRVAGGVDGLTGREGTFLMTSFWLADNLALMGRSDEARHIFKRLLGVRNDVGLLSEEYDPSTGRMLGNFPQAFSHVALINTVANLSMAKGPSRLRRARPGGARQPIVTSR
jgi:GH15 family glucan-1,4-alpha-glucosidase